MRMIVVRPAPGDARTLAQLAARGITAEAVPLFAVRPIAWVPPDPRDHDAVLLTSANALRHGGSGLAALRSLPVVAVGAATAAAARATGFAVALTGDGDVGRVSAQAAAAGLARLLHLAGRDRVAAGSAAITVYASDALAVPEHVALRFAGATILLHSARAAAAVAALVDRSGVDRAEVRLAAFSPAVAAVAGAGWQAIAVAAAPTDAALIEAAIETAIDQRAARAAIDQRAARADK